MLDEIVFYFNYRIVDQSRYTDILDLLYTNFHTDEPMSKAVGIIKDPSDRSPTLDTFALDGLKQVQWLSIENQQMPIYSDVSFILTIFPKNFWNK